MTATDLHAQALARIAEQRALIAAGTPGEWLIAGNPPHTVAAAGRCASDTHVYTTTTADSALIVAAVNGYGPLLDLIEAVLLRHVLHVGDNECRGCSDPCNSDCNPRPWPCLDATAALRSLGLVTT